MQSLRRFVLRLYALFRSAGAEQDLTREIEAHLTLLEEDFRRRGATPEEARLAARRAFGSIEATKDRQRDARSFAWLADAARDSRYVCRVLRRNPGFAAAAVATLALGIGASTAIFSVAYGVAMRPLPYPDPERLLRICESDPANGQLKHDVSAGAFHEWREAAVSLESAALFGKSGTRFLIGVDSMPVSVMSVSPAFFDVIGVRPALGPGFKPETAYTRFTADTEAVLSHGAWQRLFAGRTDVIGQHIVFAGIGDPDSYRIVGVMPAGFAFAETVDVWKPSLIVESPVHRLYRQWRYERAIARLRPDASIERARAELESVSARLGRDYPATNAGWSVTVESLHDSIVGSFGRATGLLLAAVAVVLLIACLNVGGLLVARAVARERETAVRIAIGAGMWRLVRLWLMEAAILASAGGALGLLLAWSGIRALTAAAPPGIPRLDGIALDLPGLTAAAGATSFAVAFAAFGPLAVARRRDLAYGLRAGSAGAGYGSARHTVRTGLMVAQCAGAATLVVMAILLTRSFIKLTTLDLGWDAAGVLSLKVSPPMPPELRRPWARYVEWSDRLIARVEATPGMIRAAVTTQLPLSQSYPAALARGRGKQTGDPARWPCVQHSVSDGYFEAMGIGLVSGRSFDGTDRFTNVQLVDGAQRPERGVAIVTESAARSLWPGRPAVGQALWLPNSDNVAWREVIGVVEDIHFYAVGEAPVPHVFVPWTQYPLPNVRLVVKATGSGASIAPIVREVVQAVEPGTHIEQLVPLDALAARATAQPRFTSRVVALFGVLALILAAVAIHGTLSYAVGARTREIGIRLALGASRRDILSRTLTTGLVPAAIGLIGGLALAAGLGRAFRALLFDVAPLDAGSFASGAFLLMAVAVMAALGPARAASRVDPAVTLRAD